MSAANDDTALPGLPEDEPQVDRRAFMRGALATAASLGIAGPALAQGGGRGQQPQAQQPLVAGSEGVPVPKRIKMVRPEYPAEAQARGLRGIVILDLTIDADGRVAAVDVIRSIPGLDEAAIAAVRKWEYEPVKVGGRAVSVKLTVPITFLMQLPDITRGEGIPELRVGAVPAFPQAVEARGTASAVAELTIDGVITTRSEAGEVERLEVQYVPDALTLVMPKS